MTGTTTVRRRQRVACAGLAVLVMACASWSEPGVNGPSGPTAASVLAAGPVSAAARPGPSYDATGRWFGEYTLWKGGPVVGEGYVMFVQDAEGDLSGIGDPPDEDCHAYALRRLSDGAPTIRYRVEISPVGPACGGHLSGIAELDLSADVIEGHLTGAAEDGSRLNVGVTLTRQ